MITKCFALSIETKSLFWSKCGETNTWLIPEALYLDLEGLKQSKIERAREKRERGIKNCDSGQDHYYVGGVG